MYLGELTPMQESTLVQLKSRVSELLKGKVRNDLTDNFNLKSKLSNNI